MNQTLWSYEWNWIVWTNSIKFHDTHFASWNISTLFFRNKNFKVVKEKFHRISPPLEHLNYGIIIENGLLHCSLKNDLMRILNTCRSSNLALFFGKDVLKICSKFTVEHPCRSVISIKLQSNFIETTLRLGFSWSIHGCSGGVLRKKYSENMQQRYRRTPTSTCNLKKVAKELYWNHTSAWVFSCKFLAYFRNISF